jgi:hypothetical protein
LCRENFEGRDAVFVEFRFEQRLYFSQREVSILKRGFAHDGDGDSEKYIPFAILAFSGFEIAGREDGPRWIGGRLQGFFKLGSRC